MQIAFRYQIRYWKKAAGVQRHFQEAPEWMKAKYEAWVAGRVMSTVIIIDCHCQSCSVQPWEMNTTIIESVCSNSYEPCLVSHNACLYQQLKYGKSPEEWYKKHHVILPTPFWQKSLKKEKKTY